MMLKIIVESGTFDQDHLPFEFVNRVVAGPIEVFVFDDEAQMYRAEIIESITKFKVNKEETKDLDSFKKELRSLKCGSPDGEDCEKCVELNKMLDSGDLDFYLSRLIRKDGDSQEPSKRELYHFIEFDENEDPIDDRNQIIYEAVGPFIQSGKVVFDVMPMKITREILLDVVELSNAIPNKRVTESMKTIIRYHIQNGDLDIWIDYINNSK